MALAAGVSKRGQKLRRVGDERLWVAARHAKNGTLIVQSFQDIEERTDLTPWSVVLKKEDAAKEFCENAKWITGAKIVGVHEDSAAAIWCARTEHGFFETVITKEEATQ